VERKRGERYNEKFRCQTVERMNACENILKLSRELGIHRRLLYKWRDQLRVRPRFAPHRLSRLWGPLTLVRWKPLKISESFFKPGEPSLLVPFCLVIQPRIEGDGWTISMQEPRPCSPSKHAHSI